MPAILYWPLLFFPAFAYQRSDLLFLEDYIRFRDLPSQHYRIVNCRWTYDDVRLAKTLSKAPGRFSSFTAEKDLDMVSKEPATFILNLGCPNWTNILLRAEKLNLFGKPFQWFLLEDSKTNEEVIGSKNGTREKTWNFLVRLPFMVDSDLNLAFRGVTGEYTVTSLYKLSSNGDPIKETLAEWTEKRRLNMFNFKCTAMRRWNLQGLTLPSSLVITDPDSINHLEDLEDKSKDTTSKVTYNLIKLMEFMFNMSLSYKTEDIWGAPLGNGSWNGMVGDLQRGDAVLGASPLFFYSEKLHIVEYYAMVASTRARFIFISPPLSHSSNIFILPFSKTVWMCCFLTFAVACLSLFAAINFEDRRKREKNNVLLKRKVSLSDVMVYNIGALCQQGTAAQIDRPASRITVLFTYVAYMFLYISYSASIVAILQSSDPSIQTLVDLFKSPMKTGADDVAYSQFYFRNARDEFRKNFYEKKIHPNKRKSPNFFPPEIGIEKVRDGLFAFHVETSVGYEIIKKKFTEEEKCGLQELRESFLETSDPWLVMKKNNPYAELFKIGIKRIYEAGFKTRLVRRYYTEKPVCHSKSSRFLSVGMMDCYHVFVLLLCGMIISCMVFLAEVLINKYVRKFP